MPKQLLLIEDNADHALLIQEALAGVLPDAELEVIPDGQWALEYVQGLDRGWASELPSLVILDLKLPRAGGEEILRAMRTSAAWSRVPVIVLTTSTRPSDMEACLRAGANAYVSKMAPPDYLAAQLQTLARQWAG